MSEFLQNHPASIVFPVPLRRRGHKMAPLVATGIFVLGLIGVMAFFFATLIYVEAPEAFGGGIFGPVAIAGVVAAICLVGCLVLWQNHVTLPRREQQRYNALAGHDWLDEERRAALQIVAPVMVRAGLWSETLEFQPCEAALAGSGTNLGSFRTLAVQKSAENLDVLEEWWGYNSASGYREMMTQLFEGMHTPGFASEMRMGQDHAASVRAELLTLQPGLDDTYIERCLISLGGEPPHLIWGWDIVRVITLSRLTYMAGVIDAEEAWTNILKASEWLHGMFESLENCHRNWALGRAYWNRDPEWANDAIADWAAYSDPSRKAWPIQNLPWKRSQDWSPPRAMKKLMT